MIDVSKESENMLRLSHFTIERSADAVFWVDAQSRIRHTIGQFRVKFTQSYELTTRFS